MLSLLDRSDASAGIVTDTRFKRLMSALDMYLNIFPADDMAMFRAATIVTRYEDCAMLGLVGMVAKVISKSITCTLSLCFDSGAAQEVAAMYKHETSEIIKEHSYLPYCRSMGLVNRSPYSVPMNVSFYTYYTTLLACLDNSRGLNANHLASAPVAKMLNTTVRIAYLIKGSNDNALIFRGVSKDKAVLGASSNGSRTDDQEDKDDVVELDAGNTVETDDTNWSNKILQQIKTIPLPQIDRFLQTFQKRQMRTGTIGELEQENTNGDRKGLTHPSLMTTLPSRLVLFTASRVVLIL